MKNRGKKLFGAMVMMLMIALFAMPVSAAPKLSKKAVSVTVGKTVKLSVKGASGKITWSSSSKSVASVNKKGIVKGKKSGIAKITAKIGKKKLKCTVTVRKNEYIAAEGSIYSDPTFFGYELIPIRLSYSKGNLICIAKFYNGNFARVYGFRHASIRLSSGKKVIADAYFPTINLSCASKETTTVTLVFPKSSLPKKKVDLGALKHLSCNADLKEPIWY